MYIVQIASECAPVAKVGGLGDVVYGLSRELQSRIHWVEVILPKYDCMRYDQIWGLEKIYHDLWVPGTAARSTVRCGRARCTASGASSSSRTRRTIFSTAARFYGFPDEAMRFAFFSQGRTGIPAQDQPPSRHHPLPRLANRDRAGAALRDVQIPGDGESRVCYTIHNFKHQGVTAEDILWATGLRRPEYYYAL